MRRPAFVSLLISAALVAAGQLAPAAAHEGDDHGLVAGPLAAAAFEPVAVAAAAAEVSFTKGALAGTAVDRPTSLQFGPDGRLYASQQNGVIKSYAVSRSASGAYSASGAETINLINQMPNRNDDGVLNTTVGGRLVTGIAVAGTAAAPVIYAMSSDPRIGAGPDKGDLNLDTNSGILSKLTKTASGWVKQDVVRGLPRSEENHTANGLALSADGTKLYIAQGGNTNNGATSNNFAFLPEYALSAAILSINLTAIGSSTYDLPTLDDETRSGTTDANDPFGGNDGKNQAKLVPGGPVQVHAPGMRNPYDVIVTESGRMFAIDNGGNSGWGATPIGEGPGGTCTNAVNEPGTTNYDELFDVTAPGTYGGHPNPTRGNKGNTFNASNPQSPVSTANPVECDFRDQTNSGSLAFWTESTNGLAEYTASAFGGEMKGDLLAAGFGNTIERVELTATGATKSTLISNAGGGGGPLDVIAQGDGDVFPGTIWYGDLYNDTIYVLEPAGGATCDPALSDSDGDGYTNADETAAGTDPCSPADVPPDADGDKVSDVTDANDDNDSLPDTTDPFARDANNGLNTNLPVEYLWENDSPPAGGILNLGFTGLMSNGTADYLTQFDPSKMTAGGAAGVVTVDAVDGGDAYAANNNQKYGFQFGVNARPTVGAFTVQTRIVAPFNGITPAASQSMGMFIGTGDQQNYVKLVVAYNGIEALKEVAGVATSSKQAVTFPGPDYVDLYLKVDPAAGTVQPSYTVTTGSTTTARQAIGGTISAPAGWFTASTGLAVGMLSTSIGAAPPFPATWDFLRVTPENTPTPPAETIAKDSFTRTVTGGWGSAETGGAWSVLTAGAAANFAVNGSAGTIDTPTGANYRQVHLPSTSARDVDVTARMSFSHPAGSTGAAGNYLMLRRQSSGYTRVGLYATGTKIRISSQVSTGATLLPDADPAIAYAPGAYMLRVQAEGASPTTYRARAWKVGTPEPTTWQLNGSSAEGPQTAGTLGIRTANSTGTTTKLGVEDLLATKLSGTTPPPPPPPPPPAPGLWKTMPATGVARQEVSYVEVNGDFYLGGGGTAHQKFNPRTGVWTSLAPLPAHLDHIQSVAVGGKIYYVGGLDNFPGPHVSTVYIYDPATNTFTQGASMGARGRGAGGVAVHGGKIYYAGGLHTDGAGTTTAVNWFDEYDPATNAWRALPNMPTARDHFHAVVLDGKFWAIGGRDKSIGATTTVNQAFSFASGTWTTGLAPLPTARGGFAAAAYGDEVLIIGGEAAAAGGGNTVVAAVEAYNVKTNAWRTLAPMPTPRHGIQAAVCNGGYYLAAGGTSAASAPSQVHDAFFPGGAQTTCDAPPPPPPPPPPSTAVATDTFARTVTGGWGAADLGGTWSALSGGTTPLSVSGGQGLIATPTGGSQRLLHLPGTSVRDVDVKLETTFPDATGTTGGVWSYLVLRRQADGTYLRIGLMAANNQLLVRSQTSAGAAVFPDKATGVAFTPGDAYVLRVQAEGTAPTTVRYKVWKAGTQEPTAWLHTGTTTAGPQAAGSVGVRTTNLTSTATTLRLDNFSASRLGTAG